VVSFAFNVYVVRSDTIAAFYSPATRLWELAAGSVYAGLALHGGRPALRFATPSASSLLGAVLVLCGIFVVNPEREFPGWWALLPVAGSLLLIAAGPGAWFNRVILSNRVLVWFGLISYPLYLWHWLLLSFATIIEGGGFLALPRDVRFAAVAISVLLAWLTYRFVERPLRFGRWRTRVTLALLAGMICVGPRVTAPICATGFRRGRRSSSRPSRWRASWDTAHS
jgi:peptidoglycan/LPS O-acetylase OafA/YrhL